MINLKKLNKGMYIIWNNQPFLVKDIEFSMSKEARLELQSLFSNEITSVNIPLTEQLEEADISRKVASIISKKDSQLEIIDNVTFDTIEADISPELLEQADENDSVTYIKFQDNARVIEVRKR